MGRAGLSRTVDRRTLQAAGAKRVVTLPAKLRLLRDLMRWSARPAIGSQWRAVYWADTWFFSALVKFTVLQGTHAEL